MPRHFLENQLTQGNDVSFTRRLRSIPGRYVVFISVRAKLTVNAGPGLDIKQNKLSGL
jgi:hypothetical protein